MSHPRRRHLIIAPDSPPATPPNPAIYHHPRHAHFNAPGPPRVIVQRSKFSLQNPKSPRHARRPMSPSQPRTTNPRTPAVFKLDEELTAFQPSQTFKGPGTSAGSVGTGASSSGGGSTRDRRGPRMHGLRRSESLDGLDDDTDGLYGSTRMSESEPSTGTHRTAARSMHRYKQMTEIKTLRSMKSGRASAPIQIPSRKVQMEEKRRTKLAAERAKMVTGGNVGSAVFRRSRTSEGSQRFGSIRTSSEVDSGGYSSSDDSMDDIVATKRR